MKSPSFLFSSLLFGASLIATQPLTALAAPATAVDAACMAKTANHPEHLPPMAHPPMAHSPMPPFLHGIKLSEVQQDKIFELTHQKEPQFRQVGKKVRHALEELRLLSFSERYDTTQAQLLAENAARAQSEMLGLRAETDQQIYTLLNSEQRKQLTANFAGKPDGPRF